MNGIDELKGLVGQTSGPSDWREVTQGDIDKFADVTGDHQWIHVDVERAKNESPFGTTIAHGNLTLSMIDGFRLDLIQSTGFKLVSTQRHQEFGIKLTGEYWELVL